MCIVNVLSKLIIVTVNRSNSLIGVQYNDLTTPDKNRQPTDCLKSEANLKYEAIHNKY